MAEDEENGSPIQAAPASGRSWRTWHLAVAAFVALVVGVGIGSAGAESSDDDEPEGTVAAAAAAAETTTTARRSTSTQPPPTTTTTTTLYQPKPEDFALSIAVMEKKCFGSAGCNVRYEVDLQYKGPVLRPSDTWLVTYEVHGGEDGPQINTLEVTGVQYRKETGESISTSSAGAELSAVAVGVRKR